MPYTDQERQRIGDAVRRTRVARGLDKEPAARAADINSITWKKIEDGERVRDGSLGKVLTVLGLPDADLILQDVAFAVPPGTASARMPAPDVTTTHEDELHAALRDASASLLRLSREAMRVDNVHALAAASQGSVLLVNLAAQLACEGGSASEQGGTASPDDAQGRSSVERLQRIVERVRVEQPQHGDNEGA